MTKPRSPVETKKGGKVQRHTTKTRRRGGESRDNRGKGRRGNVDVGKEREEIREEPGRGGGGRGNSTFPSHATKRAPEPETRPQAHSHSSVSTLTSPP